MGLSEGYCLSGAYLTLRGNHLTQFTDFTLGSQLFEKYRKNTVALHPDYAALLGVAGFRAE